MRLEASRETRPKVSSDGSGLAKPAKRWVSPVRGTWNCTLTARSNGEQNVAHSGGNSIEYELRHRADEGPKDLWMLI